VTRVSSVSRDRDTRPGAVLTALSGHRPEAHRDHAEPTSCRLRRRSRRAPYPSCRRDPGAPGRVGGLAARVWLRGSPGYRAFGGARPRRGPRWRSARACVGPRPDRSGVAGADSARPRGSPRPHCCGTTRPALQLAGRPWRGTRPRCGGAAGAGRTAAATVDSYDVLGAAAPGVCRRERRQCPGWGFSFSAAGSPGIRTV
jgi:hypothetical protein